MAAGRPHVFGKWNNAGNTVSGNINELISQLGSERKRERKEAIAKLKEIGKPASKSLLSAINSDSEEVRDGAAEILGTYSEENIDTFIKLLVSGRENARDGAARTIAYIADNGGNVAVPLSKVVREGKPEARRRAAVALGYLSHPINELVNMLLHLLRDDDPKVRVQAAESLRNLKWRSGVATEMSFLYLAEEDWDELAKIGSSANEALKFALERGDAEDRARVAGLLSKNEGRDVELLLLKLLQDNEKSVRLAAINAIAGRGDRRLLGSLVKLMDDSDYDVRVEASWALKKSGWNHSTGYDHVKALILQGNTRGVELMGETAIPFLIENMGDPSPEIRKNAIKLLYSTGKPAYEAVRSALNDERPNIKSGAVEAIRYFNEENRKAEEREKHEKSVKDSEVKAYNSKSFWYKALIKNYFNQETARTLSASLSNETDIIKITAIETLKGYGKLSIPIMLLLLDDDKDNVRTVAIESLGDLYATDAIEPLLETMDDKNHSVRRASAYSLGKIRDKGTLPALVRHFADPDENVRRECSESVAKMGNVALPFLENLIIHSDPDVRITTLMAVGGISDPSGIPYGTKALNDPDYNVRVQAMDSIVQMSNFMFNFLMNEIRRVSIQGTKMEKLGMLSVLSRLNDEKIVPIVKGFLNDQDEEVRRHATEILEIYRKQEMKRERDKLRQFSKETADLLKRKLSLREIDNMLDSLLGAEDEEVLELLGGKLSQDEINELTGGASKGSARETAKMLGNKLSQDEIDELLHRAAYVSKEETTQLLGKKLNQDEIDDMIKRALSEEEENAAKDIKKQLTQNEIDDLIKKELELKKEVAMEVSKLIIGLKSRDEEKKAESSEKIIEIGEPAVEPLMNFMNTAEPEFQKEVAELLIKLGKPGIWGMIRTLNYGKAEMKILIAGTILKSKDTEAVNAVYDRIKTEKDPAVKKALLIAFTKDTKDKRITDALSFSLSDNDQGVKSLAVGLLAKTKDERAIEPLISVFKYQDQSMFRLAEEAVISFGEKTEPLLIKELRAEGSDLYRERVAGTIEKMSVEITDEGDLAYLYTAKDNWEELEKLGKPAVGALTDILRDPYSRKRVNALRTLIRIGGDETVLPIAEAAFDMDEELSVTARDSLMKSGRAVLPKLTGISAGMSDPVKRGELDLLIYEIRQEADIGDYIKERNWEMLVKAGTPAIKYLSNELESADKNTTRDILNVAAEIGGEEGIYLLAGYLFDTDENIAGIAREGIINGDGKAVPVLNDIYERTVNPARREILNVLIRDISEKEEFAILVNEGRWYDLGAKGEHVIERLMPLLEDDDPRVRMGVLTALSGIGGINTVRPLLDLLFDPDEKVSEKAYETLQNQGKFIVPVISVAMFKETNTRRKKVLSDLIRDINNEGMDEEELEEMTEEYSEEN